MSDADGREYVLLGARMSMRNTSRQLLAILESAPVKLLPETGWTADDIEALRHLAAMRLPLWGDDE